MKVTPEMIAAFVDGELTGEDRLRVESAIAADPALAEQAERHRRLQAMLTARYAPIAAEKVPDRLAALIDRSAPAGTTPGEVVRLSEARARRGLRPAVRRWMPIAGPAIAASLVLAIWQPWQGSDQPGYAPAELASLLDNRLVAAQSADATERVLLSFVARDGRICRAWRDAARGGIACRDRSGWKIERKLLLQGSGTGEYRQAGSEAELLAAAQDMAEGDALDADAERRALASGWIR